MANVGRLLNPRGGHIISSSSQNAAKLFPAGILNQQADLRKFAESMPIMAWVASVDGSVSYFNRRWSEFTGMEPTAAGLSWIDALHPDDVQAMVRCWNESLRLQTGGERECRIWCSQQSCFCWHLLRWQPVDRNSTGSCGWAGVSIDIHEKKVLAERFEEEVAGRIADVQRALSQKETLLQEVHHRVRNNLQIVASLLAMQMASLKDEALITILRESERRISSMVMIHQWLYQSARVNELDFSSYAESLVRELVCIYLGSSDRVRGVVNAQPSVSLAIDQAIPCGLILNELVTNALKYAYPGEDTGDICVDLRTVAEGRVVVLSVTDKGVGLPPGFVVNDEATSGLLIVKELTNQLGGELVIEGEGGASFTVRFPKA